MKKVVNITPDKAHKMPYNPADETLSTFADELEVTGMTAELQAELGAPLELPRREHGQLADLLRKAVTSQSVAPLQGSVGMAFAAAEFLREYGRMVALDIAQARNAITYKLMEIANCGDTKHELRALELLGKHSDIGLFTERSEVTINYKDPESLESAIKERVRRILNAEVVLDMEPREVNLDDAFGRVDSTRMGPADYTYVKEEAPDAPRPTRPL